MRVIRTLRAHELRPAARLGGGTNCRDDRLVAGAAAEVADERAADLVLVAQAVEAGLDRHQDPRRAEAALERVVLVEGSLERAELEALDRAHAPAGRLHREHQARLDRGPI